MWPLPAWYFIELALICSFAAILFVSGIPLGRPLLWVAFGVILAFALLGAFSVGLTYLPIALVFAIVSLSSVLRATAVAHRRPGDLRDRSARSDCHNAHPRAAAMMSGEE